MGLFKNRNKNRTATETQAAQPVQFVTVDEYNELVQFINNVMSANHNQLAKDFVELRDEIATNGVVRDLRKLEKSHAELVKHTSVLITDHDEQLANLKVNGVATAINRLQREVLTDKQEEQSNGFTRAFMAGMGVAPQLEPTLKGKVDAIVAHLGLDIQVQPEEVIKAKIVTKKVATPKKKGRR